MTPGAAFQIKIILANKIFTMIGDKFNGSDNKIHLRFIHCIVKSETAPPRFQAMGSPGNCVAEFIGKRVANTQKPVSIGSGAGAAGAGLQAE